MDPQAKSFDPVLFEVLRNALVEATRGDVGIAPAYRYLHEYQDAAGLFLRLCRRRGRMVAQAFCQPAHLVTIGRIVPRAVAEYGAENLTPAMPCCQ